MPRENPARKPAKKAAKATKSRKTTGFSSEERAAMRDRVKEVKSASGSGDEEQVVLAKIGEMKPGDRAMAERIHSIVRASAPELTPRLWYGMPAYAKDGKVICFFQSGQKFKTRYATLGFSDKAMLDDGDMWPNAFALMKLTAAEEARIGALVKRAVG